MSPEERFEKNQRVVYYCAQKLHCPQSWKEDCIQEGMIELWRVCQSFDESRGNAFTTYAIPCVQGVMRRFCREKISMIKVPRSNLEDGTYTELIIGSLDIPVGDDIETTMGDLVPAKPDFYPRLFEDQLDDFLATIEGRYCDVAEEWVYNLLYGESISQKELAKKYNCSQPQVNRYISRFKKEFQQWLSSIDKEVI